MPDHNPTSFHSPDRLRSIFVLGTNTVTIEQLNGYSCTLTIEKADLRIQCIVPLDELDRLVTGVIDFQTFTALEQAKHKGAPLHAD